MSVASVAQREAGVLAIEGPLTLHSAATLSRMLQRLLPDAPAALTVDLGGVTESDSAGLALLMDWLAQATRRQKVLTYRRVPATLLALAELSEVRDLLQEAP